MMRESKNKIFLTLSVLTLLILISGCSTTGTPQKYFTGYDSIEMSFLDNSPPTTFLYDSQATDIKVNTIPIDVQVYNRGSSNSYGALFIHGFDPNMVAVAGYTSTYPTSLYSGPVRGANTFGGYYDNSGNFAFTGLNIPIGSSSVNLGLISVGGQQAITFSSIGINGQTFGDRSQLFNAMHLQTAGASIGAYPAISAGVVQGGVGSALNTITIGLMSGFGWGGWLKHFQLEGRNSNNPGGGMDVIEFPATMLSLPPSLEQFRQRIMVTSCFDYATHASSMVCIDPEPYSNVKKACIPTTVSLGGGQGAPVAITTIEQRPGRGRTTFVINVHLTKKDTYDELYDYFSLYKCDPTSGETVKTNDKNVIYVGYVYLSDYDITMTCMPNQIIRLDESGNGQITCSVNFPTGMSTSAYEAPMEIELWYGFSKTIYRDVYVSQI